MSMSVRRALSSDVCVNSGDRQMDPVKGSKRCQKRRRVGGRGPLFLWMVGAVRPGGPGTCIHCAARPQPARRLTVRARLALSPSPPPRAKMAGGPTRRPGECNIDLQIPPFRPQSPTASVFGPSRNPLHCRHPPSAVHCPRSTVRSPLWMPTRHSFAIFPASSRLQVNEIRLRRRTAEPSTSTSSPPASPQSPEPRPDTTPKQDSPRLRP